MSSEEYLKAAYQKIISGDEDQLFLAARDLKNAKKTKFDCRTDEIDFYLILLSHLTKTNDKEEKIENFLLNKISTFLYPGSDNLMRVISSRNFRVGDSKIGDLHFDEQIRKLFDKFPAMWVKSLKYDAIVQQMDHHNDNIRKEDPALEKIKNIIGELPKSDKG